MTVATQPCLEIEYPESDGQPMAETDLHRNWMTWLIELLKSFFAGQQVYVSGNLLIYFVEGNPKKSVAPDLFVVKNVAQRNRRVFKLWEEGAAPCFVLETTSRKTGHKDLGSKMRLYARLGVREYFLFDPERDFFEPALRGYRLIGSRYMPLEMDETQGILSEELGLMIRLEGLELGLYDAKTGTRLLTGEAQASQAKAQASQAKAQASQAEAQASQAEERAARAVEHAREIEAALEQERMARHALEVELAKLRGTTT